MKATNVEIAKSALCSETAVRGAIERGKLDTEDVDSVTGFVLAMRLKKRGIKGITEEKGEL